MPKAGSKAVSSGSRPKHSLEREVDSHYHQKPSRLMSFGHDSSNDGGSKETTVSKWYKEDTHSIPWNTDVKNIEPQSMSFGFDSSDDEGSKKKTPSGWAEAVNNSDIEAMKRF